MSNRVVEGIVLQKVDYSETSLIVKVLTAEEGVLSFIYQGAKRKKKKGNLISPLAIINISYFNRADSAMGKITSVEPAVVYKDLAFNPYKSSILFFFMATKFQNQAWVFASCRVS